MAKTIEINNRRFLGNKYKLLAFIKEIADKNCNDVKVFADLFAGTGSVASAFQDKQLITNDILYSNYISHLAWFSPEEIDTGNIHSIIDGYNSRNCKAENYMTENFADTYFSFADCSKIGYIREDIEKKFKKKQINERERSILITSLLYGMDKIAKTCGHFDSYRQGVEFDLHLELGYPDIYLNNNSGNRCYNSDINKLAREIDADLVYLDPPYNSRQYSDTYHLLENVAKWDKPEVFGVARKMDRKNLKSAYCTREAILAFEDLIKSLKCRYIMLSYNNMAEKGCDRSNARMKDEDIIRVLEAKGDVSIFSEHHKAFSAGKSNIDNNEERIFFVTVNEEQR